MCNLAGLDEDLQDPFQLYISKIGETAPNLGDSSSLGDASCNRSSLSLFNLYWNINCESLFPLWPQRSHCHWQDSLKEGKYTLKDVSNLKEFAWDMVLYFLTTIDELPPLLQNTWLKGITGKPTVVTGIAIVCGYKTMLYDCTNLQQQLPIVVNQESLVV